MKGTKDEEDRKIDKWQIISTKALTMTTADNSNKSTHKMPTNNPPKKSWECTSKPANLCNPKTTKTTYSKKVNKTLHLRKRTAAVKKGGEKNQEEREG